MLTSYLSYFVDEFGVDRLTSYLFSCPFSCLSYCRFYLSKQLVYLSTRLQSTIKQLTCLLVYCLLVYYTNNISTSKAIKDFSIRCLEQLKVWARKRRKFRAISSARLWHRCLYTCTLSTSSSTTTLNGVLILRLASHLDAFSAYPFQTQIPSGAPGGTTGKPEVCPSRSSRTSDGTTQNSNAHDR